MCPGSPWTQSFLATVDPRHVVYRTPLTPLPLEDYQEAWLDEIMGHCTRPWFINGTRAGLAILMLSLTVFGDGGPVDDCEHIIPEVTPFCVHFLSLITLQTMLI